MSAEAYLVLAVLPLAVGASGFLLYRNAIITFMSVELTFNAANLVFVTFVRQHGELNGQMAFFFTMVMVATEVVVGLAIIVAVYRARRSASAGDANLPKF